jgi:hypothetical protein
MLNSEAVSNLISKYNQPFTPRMLAGMLDGDIKEVEHLLGDLAKADKVRCISPSNSLYVRANRYTQGMAPDPRCKWNYDIQTAIKLLDLIESKSYRSVRELTKDFGRSRQFVFVYLEALASISIIGMNPHGYYIKTRLGIEQLGRYIQPGILGVLKRYSGMRNSYALRMSRRYWIE